MPRLIPAQRTVNIAGYAIENILQGRVKHYHWHDVDSLPRDGSNTLIALALNIKKGILTVL